MTEKIDKYFRDWVSEVFPYGYGSGEPCIVPAVRRFFELCTHNGTDSYDYRVLEEALTPTTTWLLIGALCGANIVEYGTSPRFAWLTPKGKKLKEYMLSKTDDELVEIACEWDEALPGCSKEYCNCGETSVMGAVCPNPFWAKDY